MCQNHTNMNDVGIIFGICFHTEVISVGVETKQHINAVLYSLVCLLIICNECYPNHRVFFL